MSVSETPKIIELDDTNTCELCDNALAKYTCPKCDLKYCSLICYRSDKHLQCSEDFYKECVEEELKEEPDEEARRKILEILERNRLANEEELLDSDDDSDVGDIAERLAGIDLDDADQVWEKLTKDEQQEFMAFLRSEDVTKLIPSWEPWWCPKNIQELDEKSPKVLKIKDFSEISKKSPAECVKFNLINVLAAYTFATRYFNGEHHDFAKEVVTCIITISLTLKSNQNFEDFDTAVRSVEFQCIESDWIIADEENFTLLKSDLENILKQKDYVLKGLSDVHNLLNEALHCKDSKQTKFSKNFPNEHFPQVKLESKNKIRNCLKKIEYLLSFAKDLYN